MFPTTPTANLAAGRSHTLACYTEICSRFCRAVGKLEPKEWGDAMCKEAFAVLATLSAVTILGAAGCRATPRGAAAASKRSEPGSIGAAGSPAARKAPASMPAFVPAEHSAGPEDLTSTSARAAVAALLADRTSGIPLHLRDIDFRKTLAQMAESCREWVDLDGDSVPEAVWGFGVYVNKDGELMIANGATGNAYTAIIQRQAEGRFRPIFTHMGLGPRVLETASNGWRDMLVGSTMSISSGSWRLLRHDGKRYRQEWECDYAGFGWEVPWRTAPFPPRGGPAWMTPMPIPRDVLADILRRQKGLSLSSQKVEIVSGCAVRGDAAGNGICILAVQLNSLKIAGKLVYLTAGKKPRNYFVYVERVQPAGDGDGGRGEPPPEARCWEHVLTQWNVGGFRLPSRQDDGRCTVDLEPDQFGHAGYTRSIDLGAALAKACGSH